MMEEVQDSPFSNDVEKMGYLQKKTSKGLCVNRYFATDHNFLHYWHEQQEYDNKDPSCEKYDVSEIQSLEKVGAHGISMNFMHNSKFKLEIKSSSTSERNDWCALLEAKKKLYSFDDLLADIKLVRISFKTKTFQTLMQLHEQEQNKWILDRLDEAFETTKDDHLVAQMRSNSSRLLLAAKRTIDEFASLCEDCEQEIFSREPKIIAHCR
jgi:RNA polymerase-binding transcription factor DksA